MTTTLLELAHAYMTAKAAYDGLSVGIIPDDLHMRVEADLARRKAMRAMIDAEDAYNAALDDEAAKAHPVMAAQRLAAE